MGISQEQATKTLQELVDEIESLKSNVFGSEAHARWLANALYLTEKVFGRRSRIYLSLASLPWRRVDPILLSPLIQDTNEYDEVKNEFHHKAYLEQLDTAKGLLKAGIDIMNLYGMDGVYEAKDASKEVGEVIRIMNLAESKLRKTIRAIPKTEREVQDKFEDLLVAMDLKYLREQERIVYSSKTYQPDFTFPGIDTALEIKLCNREGREKEIISEINDDVVAYKTKYPNIIFLVYDVGHIRDADKFKEGIESHDGVIVVTVKH